MNVAYFFNKLSIWPRCLSLFDVNEQMFTLWKSEHAFKFCDCDGFVSSHFVLFKKCRK